MPAAFLMQQMQWREALEEADTEADLQRLDDALQAARQDLLAETAAALDVRGDALAAAGQVRALMFIERFDHDVQLHFDQLGQS
jgi:molecular chaperone HscB